MRLTPRTGIRLVLVIIAIALLWLRLVPHRPIHVATTHLVNGPSALNQPGGGPAPSQAYEIYSALYQTPGQPANDPLAFADSSRTDNPQVGPSCLKPSTPDEHQLTDAFVAANQQSHRWEQKFAIPMGYRLVASDQVPAVQACLQNHSQGSAQCAAFKDLKHVRFLGVPGLDQAQTHALVSVIKSCGGFCGSGGIFAVEKSGNTWQRSPTTDFTRDCSWAY
jgi:hypothetical protein